MCPPTSTIRSHATISAIFAALLFVAAGAARAEPDAPDKIWIESDNPRPHGRDAPLTESAIASVVDKVSPGVVNVIVYYEQPDLQSLFKRPLPGPGSKSGVTQASGVIIHPSGYMLTNYHVVENAQRIEVRTRDRSKYEAEVVGVAPDTDIALLRIRSDRQFPAVPLGDSSDVDVGDFVIAIGNPMALHHTVTSGIVSAVGRRDLGVEQSDLATDFIQTDASINPGNSGGPLVSLNGEVIGINTAISRRGQGIGFAVPIDVAKNLLPRLKRQGYVRRGWLGLRVQKVTPALAKSFGLDGPKGALVTDIVDDGPAAESDLKVGDVIISFDGRPVRTSGHLTRYVSTAGPDHRVQLKVRRNGSYRTVEASLGTPPGESPPKLPGTGTPSRESRAGSKSAGLGFEVEALKASLARQLGASSAAGVVVTNVTDGSPAAEAGLRQRDVIREVDRTAIESKSDFDSATSELSAGDVVRLKLVRGGRTVYIAFEVGG